MRITWYGHAAFGIEAHNESGELRKIVLDPYNYPGCGGYLPIDETADVVCVSHDNRRYHSDVSSLRGQPEIVEALEITGGGREVAGVRLEAHEVYENAAGEGPNAMVRFTLEGITVAHQGDLGHAIEGEALEFLRGVDVLLALAGGPPTIELPDLVRSIEETRPALVLPMHYKTPKVNLKILPVQEFLDLCGDYRIEKPGSSSLEVSRETLPQATTVVVLDHAR